MGKPKRPQLRWAVDDSSIVADGIDEGECYWLADSGKWQITFPAVEKLKDHSAIFFHHSALSILMAYKWEPKPPFHSVKYRSKLANRKMDFVFPIPCPAIVDDAFLLFKHSEALIVESGLQAKADILCGYYWGLIHRDTRETETLVGESMKKTGKRTGERNRRVAWKPAKDEVLAVLKPVGSKYPKRTQAIAKAASKFGKSPRLLHDVIKRLEIDDSEWLLEKS